MLSKLGLVLLEQLGEEYTDTLRSIIAAEGAIANVVGMTQMNPPVKDLREYLTINLKRLFFFSNIIHDSSSNDPHSA